LIETVLIVAAALGLALQPGSGQAPASSCRRARASDAVRTGVRFGPGALSLTARGSAGAQVLLARFSETYWSVNLGVVEGGQTVRMVVPADRSSRPWELGLSGSGRFLVCPSRAPTVGG
jgi:hypothetical protein